MIPKLFIYATFHFKICIFLLSTGQKFGHIAIFNVFERVAYDHLVCIYLIRNTERTNIVKLKIKKKKIK